MTNIYVGNLSFDATEDQIRDLFAAHGTVERVSISDDGTEGDANSSNADISDNGQWVKSQSTAG